MPEIIKNQIINYFVAKANRVNAMPRVFKSQITINSTIAMDLIQKQLYKVNPQDKLDVSGLLHVCYDVDSGQIYIPNATEFDKNSIRPLLHAALLKIKKDHGDYSNRSPIEGSPFSSLRLRTLDGFPYAKNIISAQLSKYSLNEIPIIEANLSRMKLTVKHLPSIYTEEPRFQGGYMSPSFSTHINFIEDVDLNGQTKKKPTALLRQESPFILLNISAETKINASDKERIVLQGYRDYIYDVGKDVMDEESKSKVDSFGFLYAAKQHLYLGWPFEEVCSVFLQSASNFGELMRSGYEMMRAAYALEEEGYENPAKIPYFMTFQVDLKRFPLNIESMLSKEGRIISQRQLKFFKIIEYNPSTKQILIETPFFISPEICASILKAENTPLITRYNKSLNTIDVKTSGQMFDAMKMNDRKQLAKMRALTVYDVSNKFPDKKDSLDKLNFRSNESSRGISLSDPSVFNLRKISDYYYACDFIKKMCERRNYEFHDLDVLLGPTQMLFGEGIKGGFMDKKSFIKSKLNIPHEIVKGIFVSPPLIAIDSASMPSFASQTSTLVHEYSHNMFTKQKPYHEHEYLKDPSLQKRDELAYWDLYLSDEDEYIAHKEQIKMEIKSGLSPDEIIRNKIGGAIDAKNYPIALKFKEIVQDAVKEIEKEMQNENLGGTNTNIG